MTPIDCREARERLTVSAYGETDEPLRVHLEHCPECRAECDALASFLGEIDKNVDRASLDERDADRAWNGVVTSIARAKRWRIVSAVTAAAAVVLIAVGIYFLTADEQLPPEGEPAKPPPAVADVPATSTSPATFDDYCRRLEERARSVLQAHLFDNDIDVSAILEELRFTGPFLVDALEGPARDRDTLIARLTIVVLGQSGTSRATPVILDALARGDLRRTAIDALGDRTHTGALPALIELLDDERLRPAVMRAMAKIDSTTALPHLLCRLRTDRDAVVNALRAADEKMLLRHLGEAIAGPLRREAVDCCVALQRKSLTNMLVDAVEDDRELVGDIASSADYRQAIAILMALPDDIRSGDGFVRAVRTLYERDPNAVAARLLAFGADRSRREEVIDLFGALGNGNSIKMLARALQWDDVRGAVIDALAATDNPEAVPALVKCLRDPSLQKEASSALARLTGEDFGTDTGRWMRWYSRDRERGKRN